MSKLKIMLTFMAVVALALAAEKVLPQAYLAAQFWAAQDKPERLVELALDRNFDAAVATREIAHALAADDAELARSFVELAQERGITVDPALVQKTEDANSTAAKASKGIGSFARGFVIGEPDDLAGLAGTAAGDLFVYGDIRDVVREGSRYVRGEEADELLLGLACVGIAVTAGTYVSLGSATPARVGLSVVKAAKKTGRIGAGFSRVIARSVGDVVDGPALKRAFSGSWLQPVSAVRAAREAVKVEKAKGLMRLAGDIGTVQSKAGTRAALDGLKLVDEPKDVARLARVAEAKGTKTRAVIKLLGRGALVLTTSLFSLASWMFWAIFNLIAFVAAIKRMSERTALRVIRRRKARRAAMRARTLAAAAAAG